MKNGSAIFCYGNWLILNFILRRHFGRILTRIHWTRPSRVSKADNGDLVILASKYSTKQLHFNFKTIIKMLQQRVITATILATLVVTAVFKLPGDYFSLILGLIILDGGMGVGASYRDHLPSQKIFILVGFDFAHAMDTILDAISWKACNI